MISTSDLKAIACARLDDAKVLLRGKRFDGAGGNNGRNTSCSYQNATRLASIFRLRDESLEEFDNFSDPDVLAQRIVKTSKAPSNRSAKSRHMWEQRYPNRQDTQMASPSN
jgi:hypothetical protein